MPLHARTQIVNAVMARYAAAISGMLAIEVRDSHVWDFEHADLPVGNITTPGDEPAEGGTLGVDIHELAFVVEWYANAESGVRAVLDVLCAESTAVLTPIGDNNLGGLVDEVDLEGEELELSGEEQVEVARATQTWKILYSTPANDPYTIIGG